MIEKIKRANEILNDLLHTLEARGIILTSYEDNKWEKATILELQALNAEKAERCPDERTCICGHRDNRHKDIDDGTRQGDWGVGKCELCGCQSFELSTGKLSTSGDEGVFKALGKVVRTANNEIIAITYEGKQYFPKELHPSTSGIGEEELYVFIKNKILQWNESKGDLSRWLAHAIMGGMRQHARNIY